ncbi:flavoprotein [Streptomyces sp. NBC_00212]|uniref:flavoprotein n=1 Tax=Streptomyces sp. NBC_00212 TaxID=2975684 RepID=UPI002F909466
MTVRPDSAENTVPLEQQPPQFGARRLLYVGTGALGVMFMPMWAHWLKSSYPQLELKTMLTRSAQQFVGPAAVLALSGGPLLSDAWPTDSVATAVHVELTEWADAVLVHPATFHFTSRLAMGMADTPLLLALQCTQAPIAIAPALPPGGCTSSAYLRNLETLAARPNVVVVPPIQGLSATTGKNDASPAAPLPQSIAALERLSRSLRSEGQA